MDFLRSIINWKWSTKNVIVLVIYGTFFSAQAQVVSVTPIDKAFIKSADKIALFALPQTIFAVKCYITHWQQQPGPYVQYSRELTGREGIVQNNSMWRIDSVCIVPLTVMDASQVYVVKFGKKTDYSALEDLAQQGFIIFPLKTLEAKYFPDSVWISKVEVKDWASPFLPFSTFSSDTTYRIIVKDSLVIRQPIVQTKSTALTQLERAREISKLIQQVHQRRTELILSEDEPLPTNEKTLQWVVAELKRMEEEYLQLFLGRTFTQTLVFTTYYSPAAKGKEQSVEIFRFSPQRGISTKSDPTALPVYVSVEPENSVSTLRDYQSLFTSLSAPYISYRIPEITHISVKWKDQVLIRITQPVYQLGALVPWLPADK